MFKFVVRLLLVLLAVLVIIGGWPGGFGTVEDESSTEETEKAQRAQRVKERRQQAEQLVRDAFAQTTTKGAIKYVDILLDSLEVIHPTSEQTRNELRAVLEETREFLLHTQAHQVDREDKSWTETYRSNLACVEVFRDQPAKSEPFNLLWLGIPVLFVWLLVKLYRGMRRFGQQ